MMKRATQSHPDGNVNMQEWKAIEGGKEGAVSTVSPRLSRIIHIQDSSHNMRPWPSITFVLPRRMCFHSRAMTWASLVAMVLFVPLVSTAPQQALAFVPKLPTRMVTEVPSDSITLHSNRFNRELDEASRRRAAANAQRGAAEIGAGALLGGLIGGPFGALFGASIGADFGSKRAFDKARKEEMAKMGITEDMLKMAEEVGADLERGIDGLKATRNSLETQQSFARKLSSNEEDLYEKAKAALNRGDEEQAKKFLFDRQQLQQKLKKVLLACAEDRNRLETMERNVQILEERAMEVEALLRRSVGAKTMQDTMGSQSFALDNEDPLIKKFRDAGLE